MENSINSISIIPIGGLGEFGMNMMAYEYGDDIIIVDCGIMFPDATMPGVDVVIPDITYLKQNQRKIRAVIITHAHEDHVGGLAFFLKQIDVPVYGTEFTLALASNRLKEHKMLKSAKLNTITPDDRLEFGAFKVEFVHVTHSIPSTVSVVIKTPIGTLFHTSDFKFDQTPVDGRRTEMHKISKLGEEGILLLLADSTNAEVLGTSPSERSIYGNLSTVFKNADRKLFLCTFSSSIHRIQQFVELAIEHQRKVAFAGRSMRTNVRIASELGYLKIPQELVIEPGKVENYAPNEVAIICTGSQGEPRSALSLLSTDRHSSLKVSRDDTVLISARRIPGNERSIGHMVNHLLRRGANLIDETKANIHVSGHAAQEDLKMMLSLLSPKFYVPLHGEYKNLIDNAQVAESAGIPYENIVVAEDGERISLREDACFIAGKVPAGRVFVDGKVEVGEKVVLRDRLHLSQDGMVIPIIVLDSNRGELVAGPDLVTRGFVHVNKSEKMLEEAKKVVISAVDQLSAEVKSETDDVRAEIRSVLRRFFRNKTLQSPMILPVVMRT